MLRAPVHVVPVSRPIGGGVVDLHADLPGVAREGGFQSVAAAHHNVRANTLNGFMFARGASRRFVGAMTPAGVVGSNVLPGGQSGVFYNPNYSSQLPLWLTNSYHDLALGEEDGEAVAVVSHTFSPAE